MNAMERALQSQNVQAEPVQLAECPLDTGDMNVLCQLVEACLFMHGDAIRECELASKLAVPLEAIVQALEHLEKNYRAFDSAMRVRRTHDGCWIMDLQEIVQDTASPFYVEKQQFTKAEVMTVALAAFLQPVPRHVILFYRGKGASIHLNRWVDAGFLGLVTLGASDPSIKDVLEKYNADRDEKESSRDSLENDEKTLDSTGGKGGDGKKARVRPAATSYPCYVTTPKFAGHFNLPADVCALKAELDTWKDIYDMLG